MRPPVRKYARYVSALVGRKNRALGVASLITTRQYSPIILRLFFFLPTRIQHEIVRSSPASPFFPRGLSCTRSFRHPCLDRFRIYRGDSRAVVEKGWLARGGEGGGGARGERGRCAVRGGRVSERCPSLSPLLSSASHSLPPSPSLRPSLLLFVTMCSRGDSRDA